VSVALVAFASATGQCDWAVVVLVARLARDRLSNPEIGTRLFISP